LGRFGKVHSRGLRFLGSRCHLYRGLVNGLYQAAQLVNGEVDGVGDRTGEVLGYRRLYRQVTVSEVAQFVEQTQNGGLVTLVFRLQFFLATTRVLGAQYKNGRQQRNRDGSKQEAGVQVREDTAGGFLELGVQGGRLDQQVLGAGKDVVRRRAHLEQFRRRGKNFINRLVYEFIKQGS